MMPLAQLDANGKYILDAEGNPTYKDLEKDNLNSILTGTGKKINAKGEVVTFDPLTNTESSTPLDKSLTERLFTNGIINQDKALDFYRLLSLDNKLENFTTPATNKASYTKTESKQVEDWIARDNAKTEAAAAKEKKDDYYVSKTSATTTVKQRNRDYININIDEPILQQVTSTIKQTEQSKKDEFKKLDDAIGEDYLAEDLLTYGKAELKAKIKEIAESQNLDPKILEESVEKIKAHQTTIDRYNYLVKIGTEGFVPTDEEKVLEENYAEIANDYPDIFKKIGSPDVTGGYTAIAELEEKAKADGWKLEDDFKDNLEAYFHYIERKSKYAEEKVRPSIINDFNVDFVQSGSKKIDAEWDTYVAKDPQGISLYDATGKAFRIKPRDVEDKTNKQNEDGIVKVKEFGKDFSYNGSSSVIAPNGNYLLRYTGTDENGDFKYYYADAPPEFTSQKLINAYTRGQADGNQVLDEIRAGVVNMGKFYKDFDLGEGYGKIVYKGDGTDFLGGQNYVIQRDDGSEIEVDSDFKSVGTYLRTVESLTKFGDATQIEKDVTANLGILNNYNLNNDVINNIFKTMKYESGFIGVNLVNPNAYGYTGIIQFGNSALKAISDYSDNDGFEDLTTASLSSMSLTDQIHLAGIYYKVQEKSIGRPLEADEVYLATIYPKFLNKSAYPDDYKVKDDWGWRSVVGAQSEEVQNAVTIKDLKNIPFK
jgi:hypothetical protein